MEKIRDTIGGALGVRSLICFSHGVTIPTTKYGVLARPCCRWDGL